MAKYRIEGMELVKEIRTDVDLTIGSTIEFDLGDGKKDSYRVTGIIHAVSLVTHYGVAGLWRGTPPLLKLEVIR